MRSDPGLWQRFVTAQSAIYAATDKPGLNPAVLTDSSEFMLIVNLATDTARFKQVSERMYEMWNSRPHTLIHGDARSDNLFQANDGSCFAFIDWQTLSAGPPGFEICQLVAGTLANLDDYDRVLPEFLPLMHKMLLEASPDWVAQEYTLQMLIEDAKSVIAMCVVGCIGGLTPMFEALVSAPEHPLWQLMNSCWPRFRRCVEHLQIGTFMTTAFEVSPTVDELMAELGESPLQDRDTCLLNVFSDSPPASFPRSLDDVTKEWLVRACTSVPQLHSARRTLFSNFGFSLSSCRPVVLCSRSSCLPHFSTLLAAHDYSQ